jgi:hypothetical protein
MAGWLETLRADKKAATILVLFIPSVDRLEEPIDQDYWVSEALAVCGRGLGRDSFPAGARGLERRRPRRALGLRRTCDRPVLHDGGDS